MSFCFWKGIWTLGALESHVVNHPPTGWMDSDLEEEPKSLDRAYENTLWRHMNERNNYMHCAKNNSQFSPFQINELSDELCCPSSKPTFEADVIPCEESASWTLHSLSCQGMPTMKIDGEKKCERSYLDTCVQEQRNSIWHPAWKTTGIGTSITDRWSMQQKVVKFLYFRQVDWILDIYHLSLS